jgi:hypothetical protein
MSEDHNDDYNKGVVDGRLKSLERRADGHDDRDDNHERRLIYIERIVVGMLAIVAFTSVGPEIMGFFNAMAQ